MDHIKCRRSLHESNISTLETMKTSKQSEEDENAVESLLESIGEVDQDICNELTTLQPIENGEEFEIKENNSEVGKKKSKDLARIPELGTTYASSHVRYRSKSVNTETITANNKKIQREEIGEVIGDMATDVREYEGRPQNSWISYYIYGIFFILIALAVLRFLAQAPEVNCSFQNLKTNYPHQKKEVWERLRIGIENILNKHTSQPAVYLFLHEGDKNINEIIREIAVHSSKCFGHKKSPVEMEKEDFTSEHAIKDYGYTITQYKEKVKNGNVIVIVSLNDIPPETAKALHTICDTHNPIEKNVIIFLTLATIIGENENPIKIAEDTLTDMWSSKINYNELYPLITRVTDDVIHLTT